MRKVLFTALVAAIALTATEASAKRKNVRIYKPSPPAPTQPIAQASLIAIPPVAVAFDLLRRTSCDPNIARSTGKGDPGFDLVNGPKYGNFLVPAINRVDSYCYKPK